MLFNAPKRKTKHISKLYCLILTLLTSLSIQTVSAGTLDNLPLFSGVDLEQIEANNPGTPRVDIQYLGVGGYLIKWGEDEIMFAPSYSNPDPISLLLNTRPNKSIINRMIPDVSGVEMILVGHSHYDHLLDVPYIMEEHATNAVVYGSKTMKHLIASEVDESRIQILNDDAGSYEQAGNWIYNPSGKIRIMALKSDHAPNATLFKGVIKAADGSIINEIDWLFEVSPGSLEEDLDALPTSAFFWKEGQSFAYLVDFLDDSGNVAFRFHYEDAASTPNRGFVPESVLAEKEVDMAILTVANFNEIKMPAEVDAENPDNQILLYPQGIINNLKASHYVLGHWENFFGNNYTYPWPFHKFNILPLSVVPFTNAQNFIDRLTTADPDAGFTMPKPGAQMSFIINE